MDTLFSLIHALFKPYREDLTSLRLNNGPSIDGLVVGQEEDKCTVTFNSLQHPLMCDLRARHTLCLNMGRVIRQGRNDWGALLKAAFKKREMGRAQQPFIKANLEKTVQEFILGDSMRNLKV